MRLGHPLSLIISSIFSTLLVYSPRFIFERLLINIFWRVLSFSFKFSMWNVLWNFLRNFLRSSNKNIFTNLCPSLLPTISSDTYNFLSAIFSWTHWRHKYHPCLALFRFTTIALMKYSSTSLILTFASPYLSNIHYYDPRTLIKSERQYCISSEDHNGYWNSPNKSQKYLVELPIYPSRNGPSKIIDSTGTWTKRQLFRSPILRFI